MLDFRSLTLACCLLPVACCLAMAQEAFRPSFQPSLAVRRAPGPIAVDGQLGDPGWEGAARAGGFSEVSPRENVRPEVETDVWVTYDSEHLYVAFHAQDDQTAIRSSLTDRDAIFQDDFVGILLDTYADASWGYYLLANPRGIQGDLRYSRSDGEDTRFDIIYRSAGKVTSDGYIVEMAIPFASLRFPDRTTQTWRANFFRTRPRASELEYSWAAARRGDPCALCHFGTLTGIEGVRPGGALELIPAAVATQAGALRDDEDPASGFDNGKIDGDLGLTAKYSFKSGLTAEATINPDFSQVESDASQVDVNTTFALSFPERRPFFQEGYDVLRTNLSIVYTRNLNDPIAALKLTQRTGRSTLGYLGAYDEHSPILLPFEERSFTARGGKSLSNILRGRRTFGRASYLGAIVTDRRLEGGGGGSVAGVDGTIAFDDTYQLEFQLLGSQTREPNDPSLTLGVDTLTFDRGRHTARFDGERFEGYAQYTSFERSSRIWSFDFDYYASSPTFRAENGFETRNNSRRVTMRQSLNFYPGTGVEEINPSLFVYRSWNFEGVRKSHGIEAALEAQFRGPVGLYLEYNRHNEVFRSASFNGIDTFVASLETAVGRTLELEIGLQHGQSIARNVTTPVLGTGTDVEVGATVRPASWVALETSFEHSRLRTDELDVFSGYILRNRADLQFTRELFLRLVVEYDNFDREVSIEPLLTYRLNPFSLFYVGSARGYREYDGPTGWRRTDTQYFAKLQYLIRR
jgi:hypothetical protein